MNSSDLLLQHAQKWSLKSTLVFFRKFSKCNPLEDEIEQPVEFIE